MWQPSTIANAETRWSPLSSLVQFLLSQMNRFSRISADSVGLESLELCRVGTGFAGDNVHANSWQFKSVTLASSVS